MVGTVAVFKPLRFASPRPDSGSGLGEPAVPGAELVGRERGDLELAQRRKNERARDVPRKRSRLPVAFEEINIGLDRVSDGDRASLARRGVRTTDHARPGQDLSLVKGEDGDAIGVRVV